MSRQDILKEAEKAIIDSDDVAAVRTANKALEANIDPLDLIDNGYAAGMRIISDKFDRGEVFLPQIMMAAKAMTDAVAILEPKIKESKGTIKKGKIVIGTVEGDIHEIGKNLVITMLTVSGLDVVDLGRDCPVKEFIRAAKEQEPDIIGASALMTTSMPGHKGILEGLTQSGLRDKVKFIVGGAPVTPAWAKKIGADGYAPNAKEAAIMVKELLGVK